MIKSNQRNTRFDRLNEFIDKSRPFSTRFHSSFSNIPSMIQRNSTENVSLDDFDDYFTKSQCRLDRDGARRADFDSILRRVYDGKPLPWTNNDDPTSSNNSVSSFTNSKQTFIKIKDDFPSIEIEKLQRELKEREMDIEHLQKENQELQNQKTLLESKIPIFASNSKIDQQEIQIEELRNELRSARELIFKLQNSNQRNSDDKKKIRDYEKQLRNLTNENETLKQQCQHVDRTVAQLKRDNEELEEKVRQLIKRNDDLFIQELQLLRDDVKTLKERNETLIEENLHLRRKPSKTLIQNKENSKSINCSPWKFDPLQQRAESNQFSTSKFHSKNSIDLQNIEPTDSEHSSADPSGFSVHSRRWNFEGVNKKRPFVPQTIHDVHLNDIVKFSRPEGKVSKGLVKYIGSLPDRTDHYLGLELDEEDSKHDGVFQGQRFFQCKANKGVFVSFNKIIFAWR